MTGLLPDDGPGSVITVGTFDGVHLGHHRVLEEIADRARPSGRGGPPATLHPPPPAIISPPPPPPPPLRPPRPSARGPPPRTGARLRRPTREAPLGDASPQHPGVPLGGRPPAA